MRIKKLPGALVIAALVTLAISLGVATPNVYGGGDDSLPTLPEKPELKYPNLGSNLDQLAASALKGKTSAREAAEDAPARREASIAVTIHLSRNVDDVVKFLEDNGGSPRNVGEDYIETYVPLSLLGQVSEQPGVIRVREIAPAEPAQIAQQVAGHGPPVHGSSAWNQAGFSGQGIKVGVIDLRFGFNGFSGLMGTELRSTVQARCYTAVGRFTSNLADCENAAIGSSHGTLVAEAVVDIAPEVSLYIATPWSPGDLQTATDWMVSQGVSVIVHSAAYEYDGPGDGTSPFSDSPLRAVDRAVAGGSVWVNSAGNEGQKTWFGPPVNSDGDTWIDFNRSDEDIDIQLEAGEEIRVQLRWEDRWGGATSDFDLFIYDYATQVIVASSFDPQRGVAGHVPYESVTYLASRDGWYFISVAHHSGSTPGWIQVTVWGVDSINPHTESSSIANPAESRNAGMLAVGAAHWNSVGSIEPYSSRGPTPDGRVKPDIIGADCGATALRPLNEYRDGFCGTSQAAPHVAGMAALVRQQFPTYTPMQVTNYLKEHAEQKESPDPNNTWGHGFAKLPTVDRTALMALYKATGGTKWTNNTNWLTSRALSTWYGVITDSQGRITELNLTRNQLRGELPPEMASLTNLEVLALGGNQLPGTVPAWLGSLANLQELYLWGNELTGEIPTELGNLTNLTILGLSENQLTGPIPSELGGLTSMQRLSLSENQLTGAIPSELGGLTSLEWLYLSYNQLTGPIPAELGSLAKLKELHLGNNELTGAIPVELGSLAKLERLYLTRNQLPGTIPTQLGNLTSLTVLALGGNQLTGPIPTSLGGLTNLEGVYLWGNELTGTIPAELGSLTNLEVLALDDNQLTGAIPSELGGLTSLEWLYLSYNQLTGPIPAELGSLAKLKELHLGNNELTGAIPVELGSLAKLERLYLTRNQLPGTIPTQLGNLTSLTVLALGGNQLTGPIPTSLGGLTNLEGVYLWGNELTGTIPAELGSLTNLEVLALDDNQLTGAIPSELGSLTNLQELHLTRNQLSGAIPPELGSLPKLTLLRLENNQLSGVVPQTLAGLTMLDRFSFYNNPGLCAPVDDAFQTWLRGISIVYGSSCAQADSPEDRAVLVQVHSATDGANWTNTAKWLSGDLTREWYGVTNDANGRVNGLFLRDNQLSGEIPAGLGSLANLTGLSLSVNRLTGTIPADLGSLSNLTGLYLHENQLTGPIPAELGRLTGLQELSLRDNQLSGAIPPELSRLTKLERLSLSQNMLTGCVPEAWQDIAESDVLELGLPFCAVSLNTAPVFSDSESNPITEAGRSVVENTAAGENVGTPVAATDNNGDTPTYALGGTDAASFDIDPLTGQLMTKEALDYETKSSYEVMVTATDPEGASDMITVTITVTNEEEMGEVTLWASATEALTMAPQVGETITGAVMDPDGGVMVESWQWSRTMDAADMDSWMPITGATDAAYMVMEGDNGYYLRATAMYDDGEGMGKMASEETMMVMMMTMNAAPMFESKTDTREVPENTAAGEDIGSPVTAMDADNDTLTYSLSGTDMASFDIGSATGQLMTLAALDFETKPTYSVTVTASDSGGLSDSIDVTVTVTDVDEDVVPADPLVDKYDANENGEIERAEVFAAINDYLDEGADAPTRADVFKLIELYLGD